MRTFGLIALVVGLLGLFAGLSMETTVSVATLGTRVHNIGLMNEKQNMLLTFSVIGIVGAILFSMGLSKKVTTTPAEVVKVSQEKACPFCAEMIKSDAILCRFCRSPLSKPPSDLPDPDALKMLSVPQCAEALTGFGCHVVEPTEGVWEIKLPTGVTGYAYSHEDLVKLVQRQSNKGGQEPSTYK